MTYLNVIKCVGVVVDIPLIKSVSVTEGNDCIVSERFYTFQLQHRNETDITDKLNTHDYTFFI